MDGRPARGWWADLWDGGVRAAAPDPSPETAAESIATDSTMLAPAADTMATPTGITPDESTARRRPALDGRSVRARQIIEVRTKFLPDGQVDTYLYRREPAALAHAGRLRSQGYPVELSYGVITWTPGP